MSMTEDEERRIGRAVVPTDSASDRRGMELAERGRRSSELANKEIVKAARSKTQADLAGMSETAVAALYSLLVHEDPAVRMKALTLWFTKMVPTVAAERAEEDDGVIDVGGPGFDDLVSEIDKLKRAK